MRGKWRGNEEDGWRWGAKEDPPSDLFWEVAPRYIEEHEVQKRLARFLTKCWSTALAEVKNVSGGVEARAGAFMKAWITDVLYRLFQACDSMSTMCISGSSAADLFQMVCREGVIPPEVTASDPSWSPPSPWPLVDKAVSDTMTELEEGNDPANGGGGGSRASSGPLKLKRRMEIDDLGGDDWLSSKSSKNRERWGGGWTSWKAEGRGKGKGRGDRWHDDSGSDGNSPGAKRKLGSRRRRSWQDLELVSEERCELRGGKRRSPGAAKGSSGRRRGSGRSGRDAAWLRSESSDDLDREDGESQRTLFGPGRGQLGKAAGRDRIRNGKPRDKPIARSRSRSRDKSIKPRRRMMTSPRPRGGRQDRERRMGPPRSPPRLLMLDEAKRPGSRAPKAKPEHDLDEEGLPALEDRNRNEEDGKPHGDGDSEAEWGGDDLQRQLSLMLGGGKEKGAAAKSRAGRPSEAAAGGKLRCSLESKDECLSSGGAQLFRVKHAEVSGVYCQDCCVVLREFYGDLETAPIDGARTS
eukprot:gnl/TRDRNA2_/TRDRNA2_160345_c0_seq5.p1 gnl/TRDRNA2_/TRDRNA2_160345_c0~~gnl/TRDRNA2_/TRDRNA2_160345_c0_seq5.p1  ORF type:complete len:523 (-),score=82.39 gnl/TRDRNA2_/TRDRNA2_160345_c0_seq5:48-1616(-)